MENVISFTFVNWITVLLMVGAAFAAFVLISKGGTMLMNKYQSEK